MADVNTTTGEILTEKIAYVNGAKVTYDPVNSLGKNGDIYIKR